MDILKAISNFWVRRCACPDATAINAVAHLDSATVITGASEGFGLALARQAAIDSSCIILIGRSSAKLEKAASSIAKLQNSAQCRILTATLDVADPSSPDVLDQLLTKNGCYLDILVNNAAIGDHGDFSTIDERHLDELISTNVAAVTKWTRHYLPRLRRRARGGIINVASLASFVPGPCHAAYFASKAYVLSLTLAVSKECSGGGVRICALAPGPIKTEILDDMRLSSSLLSILLPSLPADVIARRAWRSFQLGRRLVVPGLMNGLFSGIVRVLPVDVLLWLVFWLTRPRGPKTKTVHRNWFPGV